MAAQTYSPNDALLFAKRMIKNMRLEDVQYAILDDACKYVWNAANWSWTVDQLDAVQLALNTTTYTITYNGGGALPANFQHLVRARLVDTIRTYKDLWIDSNLPASPITVGEPVSLCKVEGASTIRISHKPGTMNNTKFIEMWYKKSAPKIDNTNYATAGSMLLDDNWFYVYKHAVLYCAYLFGDDERAGSASYDVKQNAYRFSGQRAILEAALEDMRERVPLPFKFDPYNDSAVTRD